MSKQPTFTAKRKLSSKEIVGDIKSVFRDALLKDPKVKRVDLYSVAGVVKRCEQVETTYGESTRLIGDFLAVNKITGEMFRSNRVFLPKIVSEELEAGIDPASKTSAEFAINVAIIPDDKSGTGYVYIVEPVVKVRESDAMANLAKQIGVDLGTPAPALPAPGAADQKTPAAPAEKDKGKSKGK